MVVKRQQEPQDLLLVEHAADLKATLSIGSLKLGPTASCTAAAAAAGMRAVLTRRMWDPVSRWACEVPAVATVRQWPQTRAKVTMLPCCLWLPLAFICLLLSSKPASMACKPAHTSNHQVP